MLGRFLDWLQRETQNPARLIFLAAIAGAVKVVGSVGFHEELMHTLASVLCAMIPLLFMLGSAIMIMRPPRTESSEHKTYPQSLAEQKPHHDIYSENAYAILGVAQHATRAEIRAAYRKLVQQHHPDAVSIFEKERAAAVLVHINLAYELLTHSKNRIRYDAWKNRFYGEELPLDLVCATFKDSQALAEFDASFTPKLFADEGQSSNLETQSEANASQQKLKSSPIADNLSEPAPCDGPLELEMPDAVREALRSQTPKDDAST